MNIQEYSKNSITQPGAMQNGEQEERRVPLTKHSGSTFWIDYNIKQYIKQIPLLIMKKYLILIGIAVVTFAACSSEENPIVQKSTGVNTDAPIDDENLSYEHYVGTLPIEFAGVKMQEDAEFEVEEVTRGNVSGVSENKRIGVFCLSYRKLDNELGDSYFHWTDGKYKTLNRWQDNAKAHIKFTNATDGALVWDDPNTPHYYPKYDTFAYQFAAYQPYTEVIAYAKKTIYAWMILDGDDDVMYAVSDKPRNGVVTEELAFYSYGNHYFEEVASTGEITADHKPYFTFRHVLAQVNFDIKLKASAPTSDHTFRVDSISIRNLVNIGRLKVANLGDGTIEDGSMVCFADINSTSIPDEIRPILAEKGVTGKGNFWMREKDGTSIRDLKVGNEYKYLLSTEAKTIGGGIFIPTSSTTLTIDIFLCDENGNRFTSTKPIVVNKPSDAGWKAGKHYTIPITVTPPKYFMDETRGSVLEWDADTGIDGIIPIDVDF